MTPAIGVVVVVLAIAWRLRMELRSVERLVTALGEQLSETRRAHEHQHYELHRRLDGIEAATGRAEREARAVSDQLTNAMAVVS